MKYRGSCHCGQTAFEVEGDLGQVMECNCSHCSRKGYLLWFVPRAQFSLSTPEDVLHSYRFNRHRFCGNCGCAPFAFGQDRAGNATAAVNVRCLENVDLTSLKRIPVDGRSL
jgi:hypothetical protein